MPEISMKKKLEIVNKGGYIQESGANSWVGTRIRKGDKYGVVTQDLNGMYRILTVRFSDDSEEEIRMNNIGADPKENNQYEWETTHDGKPIWYRF